MGASLVKVHDLVSGTVAGDMARVVVYHNGSLHEAEMCEVAVRDALATDDEAEAAFGIGPSVCLRMGRLLCPAVLSEGE